MHRTPFVLLHFAHTLCIFLLNYSFGVFNVYLGVLKSYTFLLFGVYNKYKNLILLTYD